MLSRRGGLLSLVCVQAALPQKDNIGTSRIARKAQPLTQNTPHRQFFCWRRFGCSGNCWEAPQLLPTHKGDPPPGPPRDGGVPFTRPGPWPGLEPPKRELRTLPSVQPRVPWAGRSPPKPCPLLEAASLDA